MSCGTENPADHGFCQECGKPLTLSQPAAGPSPVPVVTTPAGSGGNRTILLVLAGGFLGLILMALAGIFILLPLIDEPAEPGFSAEPAGESLPAAAQTYRSSPADPVTGTWEAGSGGLILQFDPAGSVILEDPAVKEYATGRWEQLAEGKYRIGSSDGTTSMVLLLDPLSGTLHSEEYTLIFSRTG